MRMRRTISLKIQRKSGNRIIERTEKIWSDYAAQPWKQRVLTYGAMKWIQTLNWNKKIEKRIKNIRRIRRKRKCS